MIKVTLLGGRAREFERGVTGTQILSHLGDKALIRSVVAVRCEGHLYDLSHVWEDSVNLSCVTRDEQDGLEILRHDAAHVMAQAVKELYPEVQVTIGPVIEDGFYYDFFREAPFTPSDFQKIQSRMKQIVKRNLPIVREEWDRDRALAHFAEIGEDFKRELIASIPEDQVISIYRQGDFLDLCRGPHLPSTGHLGTHFKLMKVAGAYWRGDSSRPMLQRIYGTAWASEADLELYLKRLEEAEKRDHRRLGKEMHLFHFQDEAVGSVFWHPRGWHLYQGLLHYMRSKLTAHGYEEVNTPQLVSRELWEKSGHWDKFRENMMVCHNEGMDEGDVLAVKPMNCPCHIQIFKQGVKSYRDLPLRMAEFGSCIRYEPSGALSGLMRVRAFTQDDAHIFCTPDQIESETKAFCGLLYEVYRELGFEEIEVRFSDRPEKRAGEEALWDQAEDALRQGAEAAGLTYTLNPGEGAFYGPKLEFVLKDALGRRWQCGTLQVDFILPERLDAQYVGSDGAKHRPVMLHRAILGSFERFLGIMIEHYGGKFPLWLAPLQVVVATITKEADDYAHEVTERLKALGIRVLCDTRNEKIGYKVRAYSLEKCPYIWVVGKQEQEERTVSVRTLGSNGQNAHPLEKAIDALQNEVSLFAHSACES